ncbi:MAG: 8-oxo-dGTP diphosphatase [Verrucomicrobia bacterium]|nr:8-oxo-dGTP diphosphatase [Verrucomicrobiota bacterium]MBV9658357.1 8-oxo-dGTP diphosphatase [Verrucomicrobiota bacterium]
MTAPPQLATLLYVHDIERDQLLLIRKKRGIGAGKINGPGGKAHPGETALEAAVRETQEETGVTPLAPVERGELTFLIADGYALHCHVFLTHSWQGEIHETAEAIPFWAPAQDLPFAEMWDDDRLWLPLLLAGRRFRGVVTISTDGQSTTDRRIEVVD